MLISWLNLAGCDLPPEREIFQGEGILKSGTSYGNEIHVELAHGYEPDQVVDTACFGPIEPPLTDSGMADLLQLEMNRESAHEARIHLEKSIVVFGFRESSSGATVARVPFLRCHPMHAGQSDFVMDELIELIPPSRSSPRIVLLDSNGYSDFIINLTGEGVESIEWNIQAYRASRQKPDSQEESTVGID